MLPFLITGYLHLGKWLKVGGQAAISSACCCITSYGCLTVIPRTLYLKLVGNAPLAGQYSLTWNDTYKRWEITVPADPSPGPGPEADILITVNVLDCGSSPVSPDADMSDSLCAQLDPGSCLIFTMRCAPRHFVNSPTEFNDETHTPHITGNIPVYSTNDCVLPSGPFPDYAVYIADDPSLLP